MMVALFYLLIFFVSLCTTLAVGAPGALVLVYLPVHLLFSLLPMQDLMRLPDVSAPIASVYGILLGLVIQLGTPLRFRWNAVDVLVLAMAAMRVLSAFLTYEPYTGVSTFGNQVLTWVAPYFLARIAFQNTMFRNWAVGTLIVCAGIVGLFCLIEFRLWPNFYRQNLEILFGLEPQSIFAYKRLGFFRARATFEHPIYLGNAGIVMLGMFGVLASTTRWTLRHPLAWMAMLSFTSWVIVSISYGPYLGLLAGALVYLGLRYVPAARGWMPLWMILMAVGMFMTASWMRSVDLNRFQTGDAGFEASLHIRSLIVQRSWEKAASAPIFSGHPRDTLGDLNLDSVDNAYLVFIMLYGWAYFALWVAMAVAMGWQIGRAFGHCRTEREANPLLIGTAALVGVLVAMFNVWGTDQYVTPWVMLLAFTMTLGDFVIYRPAPAVRPATAPGGTMPMPAMSILPVTPPAGTQELIHGTQ